MAILLNLVKSSSALPSIPSTQPLFFCLPSLLLLFFVPSCFRTLDAFVVVFRSVPKFPFRAGMPVSQSAHDLAL